jgi:hypothetical protein
MVIRPNQNRWWHRKANHTSRQDLHDALLALRQYVENQGKPAITLAPIVGVARARELTDVATTRVQEWTLGYRVIPLNDNEGFFLRSVFLKLHGGKLSEINKTEREQIIEAVASAALDDGAHTTIDVINDHTMVIHQPFAVMFWNERNPNILVPSKELLRQATAIDGGSNNRADGKS